MAVKSKEREYGRRMKRKGGGSAKVARSSRELVAYDSMLPGGVAYLGQDRWSVTLRISDISYQIASQDVQMDVVERWGRFLNSVGEGMGIQVTVMTRTLDPESAGQGLAMGVKGDGLDALREDFDRHVRRKLSGQSSGTVCDKYLTLTLAEQNGQRAVATLYGFDAAAKAGGHIVEQGREIDEASLTAMARRVSAGETPDGVRVSNCLCMGSSD